MKKIKYNLQSIRWHFVPCIHCYIFQVPSRYYKRHPVASEIWESHNSLRAGELHGRIHGQVCLE